METTTVRTDCMTEGQAKMLSRILYPNCSHEVADRRAESIRHLVDERQAHRILAYVLSHLMSDEHNAQYVAEALQPEEES